MTAARGTEIARDGLSNATTAKQRNERWARGWIFWGVVNALAGVVYLASGSRVAVVAAAIHLAVVVLSVFMWRYSRRQVSFWVSRIGEWEAHVEWWESQ